MPVPDAIPDLFPTPGGEGDVPDLFPAVDPDEGTRRGIRDALASGSWDKYGSPESRPPNFDALVAQEQANRAKELEAAKTKAVDETGHRERVRQAVRGFMDPDPALDSYLQQKKSFTDAIDPNEQGVPRPTAPVISSYADPRFKNLQTKLGTKLGRTMQADDILGLLQDQGYGINQAALERGDGGYDPNALLRAPQQAVIGAGKVGANLIDIVGALDPREATNVQTNPNVFQRQAFDSRQGIAELEGAYKPNRLDGLYQSIAPLLMTLGPAKLAAGGAAALGAGEGLASTVAGATAGTMMGGIQAPEVYRESVDKGMTQGQALGNVAAATGVQAAGMAAGGRLMPFKGLTALAQPEVMQMARGRIVEAAKRAIVGMPAHAAEGALTMGVTQGMDVVRQLLTTNPEMTDEEAISQVEHAIVDGTMFGTAGGLAHGAMDVGRAALPPKMQDVLGRRPAPTRVTDAIAPESPFDAKVREARAQVPTGEIPDLFANDELMDTFLSDVTPTQKFDKNDRHRLQQQDAQRPTEAPVVDRQGATTDKVIRDAAEPLPDLFGPDPSGDAVLRGNSDRGGSSDPARADASRESDVFAGRDTGGAERNAQAPADVRGEPEGAGRDSGRPGEVGNDVRAGEPAPRSTESAVFGRPEVRNALPDRADADRNAGAAESARAGDQPGSDVGSGENGGRSGGRAGADDVAVVEKLDQPEQSSRVGQETFLGKEEPAGAADARGNGGVREAGAGETSGAENQGPRRLEAGDKAPDGLRRAVERINKQLDGLGPLPDKLPQNPAGNGHGPGNPKYQVPLRPDMTYSEFKARLDPKDRALLDKAKGNPAAAKALKERFGWSDKHNEVSRPYENMQRNVGRGLGGELQGGTNKNIGRAHQALNDAGRENAGRGRPAEASAEAARPADHPKPENAPAPAPVGPPRAAPVVEPRRANVARGAGTPDRAGDVAGKREFKLPRDLSKIAPRYGYRDQNFQLEFQSDFDRAAYALANSGTRSKAHTRILEALQSHSGLSETELADHGRKVREQVKQRAKESYGQDVESLLVPENKVPGKKPKLSAEAPAEFSEGDFASAERVDPGMVSDEHQAAIDVADHLGISAEVAHLPENVEGAYNPNDGAILIGHDVPEGSVGRVMGHELTHRAIDELPDGVRTKLADDIRSQIGAAEADRLIEQAKQKWGEDVGGDGLLHEMLADSGGSIVHRRGISWLIGDRTAWQHVTDWMDRTVTALRAKLGSTDARMKRIAEQIISDYGRARSTAHQNGANLAFESHFKGNTHAAIRFAIRDLAKNDQRFLASSERKFERILKPFGAAGAEMAKLGAQIVRRIMSPSYFAGKFPEFGNVFAANRAREEHQVRILDKLREQTPKFTALSEADTAKVEEVIDYQANNSVELTDAQMRQRGLSDNQIEAVIEARTALRQVMDEKRSAIEYSFGLTGSPTPAQVRAQAKAPGLSASEAGRLNFAAEMLAHHDALVKPGYFPRMRFGKHRKLAVADNATGAVLHYEHVENDAELQAAQKRIEQNFGQAIQGAGSPANLDIGRLVDRADQESYGFTESELISMATAAGVDPKILADFLGDGVSEHLMAKGFNRHMLPSNNTPGYSRDIKRVLASYALSASHGISLIRFNADIKIPMETMAKQDTQLHQYATQYKDYVLNRQNDGAWLRNLAFVKYLGFNVGSAVTNLTQVPLVTAPFMFALSGKPSAVVGSWKNAMESVAAAFAEVGGNAALAAKLKSPNLDMVELYADHIAQKNPQLAAALRAARANGIMTQADVRAFTAMAQRGGNSAAGKAARGFANAAALPFAKSERAVRLATFVAAHELAQKSPANSIFWRRANDLGYNGKPNDSAALAAWVVDETQGVYGKANRPELFRHWSTAPVYIFKQFAQTVLTTLYKLGKVGVSEAKNGNVANAPLGAVAAYFAQSMIAGGIWNALPGAQSLKSAVDTIWSSHGGKRSIEVELDKLLGETGGELVNRGALGFLPGPLGEYGPAIGRRSGLGNAVPPADDLGAILGPGLGAIRDTASDIGLLTSGDPWAQAKGAADLVAGRSGKGVVDAIKAGTSSRGIETDTGKTLIPQDEVDKTDVAGLALGLPTRHIDEAKRANKAIQDVKAGAGDDLHRIVTRHVDGLLASDSDEISAAMKELNVHNAEAKRDGRLNELIAPETYKAAVKAEWAERKSGLMNNRGIPKKSFKQIQDLRKSSARYQAANEAADD